MDSYFERLLYFYVWCFSFCLCWFQIHSHFEWNWFVIKLILWYHFQTMRDLLMHLWLINLWEYDMITFEMNQMMIEWLISFEWNGWNFLNYELFLFSLKLFEIVVNINRDVVWNDNWYSWNGTKEKEEFVYCLIDLFFGDDRYGLKDCDILRGTPNQNRNVWIIWETFWSN